MAVLFSLLQGTGSPALSTDINLSDILPDESVAAVCSQGGLAEMDQLSGRLSK